MKKAFFLVLSALLCGFSIVAFDRQNRVEAQSSAPGMTVPNLAVRTTVANLITPISMAFLSANDFLVLEKNTGKVQRIVIGSLQGTVLDLGESLLIGRNFGTVTDILTGPNGNLFVVSIDKGSVFEIFRRR